MPKFSANLGFLFLEEASNIIEQFHLAKKAGFRAVEHPFPAHGTDIQHLLKVKEELQLVYKSSDHISHGKNDENLKNTFIILSTQEVALVNIQVSNESKFGCASLPDLKVCR